MPRINLRILIEDKGHLEVRRLDDDGTLGATTTKAVEWPQGMTVAEPFQVGTSRFVLFLRNDTGDLQVHPIEPDGSLATASHRANWTKGWSSIAFYRGAGTTYLFHLKQTTGDARINAMNGDGSVGSQTFSQVWTKGWSTAITYNVSPRGSGSTDYLFLLKRTTGDVHIHELNENGTVGQRVYDKRWTSGWTTVNTFKIGNTNYLFLLKRSSGVVRIHEITNGGTVGQLVFEGDWTAGWSTAEFYRIGDTTYLFLLKESTGDLHIHEMDDDGTVGTKVMDTKIDRGFTSAAPFLVPGPEHFILLQKELDERPLRRAFVEQRSPGLPSVGTFLTDDDGHVRDDNGDKGIDVFGNSVDIRLLCHNAVLKLTSGPIPHGVHHTDLGDEETIVVKQGSAYSKEWRILNRCVEVYDLLFRNTAPFDGDDFPVKPSGSLDDRLNTSKRIELIFPDQGPQPLAYVEPHGILTKYPVIHLKKESEDRRLFGGDGNDPILVPAEVSHALHFSILDEEDRAKLEADYAEFLVVDIASGGTGTHFLNRETDSRVAFVEALDHLCHRYLNFVELTPGAGGDDDSMERYLWHELGLGEVATIGAGSLGSATINPSPLLSALSPMSSSIEGVVFGAIYLDLARRPGIGLRNALGAVLRSKTVTFGQFRTWLAANEPSWTGHVDEIVDTWSL